MPNADSAGEDEPAAEFLDHLRFRRSQEAIAQGGDFPGPAQPQVIVDSVLLIEDEPQIRSTVRTALSDVTTRVDEAMNGVSGVEAALAGHPDLVVLDLGLPDIDGLEVCRRIRAHSSVPIMVLSARDSEPDKLALFNAGVDDYVTKPFSVLEFAARAKAQLRRAKTSGASEGAAEPITAGGLVLDLAAHKATRDGIQIHLTPIEWQILATLVRAAGRTLTHQQIFDSVWGRQFGNPQQYLRVHITNLRRKIEARPAEPRLVVTEPGIGYRVELPG